MYNYFEGGVIAHFLPRISCLVGKMISVSTLIHGFSPYAVFHFIFSLKGISRMFIRAGSGKTDEAVINSAHQHAQVPTMAASQV